MPASQLDVERRVHRAERKALVKFVLAKLPREAAVLIQCIDLGELTQEEVARALERPLKTVKTQHLRARARSGSWRRVARAAVGVGIGASGGDWVGTILAKSIDMATMTKTTVEVKIGEYSYTARLDGNRVDVYRDGVLAGHSTWSGQTIYDFPPNVSLDALDALSAGIRENLAKSWRAAPPAEGDDRYNALGPTAGSADGSLTQDAANQGQMGNEADQPARQGEKEVGVGGPGHDPNTGEIGGQALKPGRRAVGDGFRRPTDDHGQRR